MVAGCVALGGAVSSSVSTCSEALREQGTGDDPHRPRAKSRSEVSLFLHERLRGESLYVTHFTSAAAQTARPQQKYSVLGPSDGDAEIYDSDSPRGDGSQGRDMTIEIKSTADAVL